MAGYTRHWERLRDALRRLMATGVSEDKAARDICNAVADGSIDLRITFVSPREFFSSSVRYVKRDEISARLTPGDFDWSQSRVRNPRLWQKVRPPSGSVLGHWQLIESAYYRRGDALPQSITLPKRRGHVADWHRVELFRDHVTKVLIAAETGKSDGKRTRAKRRSSPSRERAQRAIETLYPHGVPDQATEPNPKLFKRVGAMLKEQKLPDLSNDTILRAAGRRK